jgi:hypothetical protein
MEPSLHDWDEEMRSNEAMTVDSREASIEAIAESIMAEVDAVEAACTECTDDEWRGVVLWMSVMFENLAGKRGPSKRDAERIHGALMPAMRRVVERDLFGGNK